MCDYHFISKNVWFSWNTEILDGLCWGAKYTVGFAVISSGINFLGRDPVSMS